MKAKTIRLILTKVHEALQASITDETVRKLVRDNTIISGGSIVSMLTGEEVNDFDFYFTNKETAVAVAKYYLAVFKETHSDYKDTEVWLNPAQNDRIEFSNGNRQIVGNAPTESDEEDNAVLDMLFGTKVVKREEDAELTKDEITNKTAEEKPKYRPIFLTSNSVTLSNRVQLVLRFYGTPEEIHSNYDFIHATSYWLSKTNELVLPQAALESILAKELRYTGSKYPICSIFRTKKFIQRGWTVNAGQYLKMIWQARELDLTNVDVLRDQLVGVDSAYFSQVIHMLNEKRDKALEEGKTYTVDSTYLFTIINRIF